MIRVETRRYANVAILAVAVAALSACGSSSSSQAPAAAGSTSVEVSSSGASVRTLAVSNDSLRVDKVGGRDASLHPDGLLDLAFSADVTGPFVALFLLSTDERGEPNGVFRTNTMIGPEEAPPMFGGTLELGRMSPGIGVYENGKPINNETGGVTITPGPHRFTLYVSNLGNLLPGTYVRLFGIQSDRSIIRGPNLKL